MLTACQNLRADRRPAHLTFETETQPSLRGLAQYESKRGLFLRTEILLDSIRPGDNVEERSGQICVRHGWMDVGSPASSRPVGQLRRRHLYSFGHFPLGFRSAGSRSERFKRQAISAVPRHVRKSLAVNSRSAIFRIYSFTSSDEILAGSRFSSK